MADLSETRRARRYVARCAASILSRDALNEWLYEDESDPSIEVDEPTARRRKKALARLVDRLRREGAEEASRG